LTWFEIKNKFKIFVTSIKEFAKKAQFIPLNIEVITVVKAR
jgi:hypothetical protein